MESTKDTTIPKYSTARAEEPVEIDGRRHVLRSLTAKARSTFMEEVTRRALAREKGVDLSGKPTLEALILSLSLFDETGATVKADVIDSWPAALVVPLAERVSVLSGVTKGDADEVAP